MGKTSQPQWVDCVFWTPTIYHKEHRVLEEFTDKFQQEGQLTRSTSDVSDGQGKYRVYLEARLIPPNEDGDQPLTPADFAKLSDKEKIGRIVLTAFYESRNEGNVDLSTKPTDPNRIAQVELQLVQASRNGMLHYAYDETKVKLLKRTKKFVESNDPNIEDLELIVTQVHFKTIMPNAAYSLIKGFFHSHEFHVKEGDEILKAFIPEDSQNIDIKDPDNEALVYYLKQFEDRLRLARRNIRVDLDKILKELKEGEEYSIIRNVLLDHGRIDEACSNALGEALYYEALVNSWYNESFKKRGALINKELSPKISITVESTKRRLRWNNRRNLGAFFKDRILSEEYKEMHRCALNIDSAVEGIRLIQLRNKTLFKQKSATVTIDSLSVLKESLDKSDIVARRSLFSGIVGVVLGVLGAGLGILSIGLGALSVILSIFFSCKSNNLELPANFESKVDSIVHQKNIAIENKLDSVLENNKIFMHKLDSLLSKPKPVPKPAPPKESAPK